MSYLFYTIDQTNIATILPQLQTDAGTITAIQNAVTAGMTVTVLKSDITFNGWTALTVASLPTAFLAFCLYAVIAAIDYIAFWALKINEFLLYKEQYV